MEKGGHGDEGTLNKRVIKTRHQYKVLKKMKTKKTSIQGSQKMKTKRHQHKTFIQDLNTRHPYKTSIQGSQKMKTKRHPYKTSIQDLNTRHQYKVLKK